jgi:hypothetical protein
MRALLSLSDDRTCDCAGIDRIANEHLREVDRKLTDLTALRRELKAVIDSCDGDTVAECRSSRRWAQLSTVSGFPHRGAKRL